MTDPVSDFLTRIKNAYLANRLQVEAPYSKIKHNLATVLNHYGYLGNIEVKGKSPSKKIIIDLLYINKIPKLTGLEIVSRPSSRVYVGYRDIPKVLGGKGMSVLSTPEGILPDTQAKKKKLGGELICKIW